MGGVMLFRKQRLEAPAGNGAASAAEAGCERHAAVGRSASGFDPPDGERSRENYAEAPNGNAGAADTAPGARRGIE